MSGNGHYKVRLVMPDGEVTIEASGDAKLGASLIVWAIAEGRKAARQVDEYLVGESRLPP